MAARNRTMDWAAMRRLAILVLLLVPLAAVPLVGIWAVAVSGVGLVVVATVLLARPAGREHQAWTAPVRGLVILGGAQGDVRLRIAHPPAPVADFSCGFTISIP